MGYNDLQEEVQKKKGKLKFILLIIGVIFLVAFVIFSFIVPPESWKYYFNKPNVSKRQAGEMRIHYLDVGQGDATLIELPDGKVMLIDGGDGTSGTKKNILRYCNALKIDVIDYLVITHSDDDHCGSLDEVLRYKKVLNAYLPYADETKDGEYSETYNAILEEKCKLNFSSRSIDLSVAEGATPYTLSFLYPYSAEALGEVEEESNDTSAVIWLDYMGVSALFLGDVTSTVENKLMRDHRLGLLPQGDLDSTEILKVAHHGSKQSTSEAFLSYLGSETAIISYGKDNIYQHPSSAVLDRLSAVSAKVYRTAIDGHIMVTVKKSGEYAVQTIES